MYLGAHESTAGGLERAFERCAEHAGECLQIFTRSQRQWSAKPVGVREAARFRAESEHRGIPLGRVMAEQLTSPTFFATALQANETMADLVWSDYYWVYIFAFMIGFSTTIAEPALIAVAIKANEVSGGAIGVWGLRISVALGVAIGISLGCYRIVVGDPIHWYIIAGYVVVVLQTTKAPKMIIPLAYDSGGVTTSTVTVPLVAALGLGLSENVPGRNPLIDGFGLIAFASLFPIMSVMAYAQLAEARTAINLQRSRKKTSNDIK